MLSVFTELETTGTKFAGVMNEAGAFMHQAAARSSDESNSLLEKLANGAASFKESVSTGAMSFADEVHRGARSLETVVDGFRDSVSRLDQLIDRAKGETELSAARIAERTHALHATLAEVDAGFQRVREASVPFGRAADQIRGAIDLLRATQSIAQEKITSLEAAGAQVASASSSLATSLERDIAHLSSGFDASTKALVSSIESIATQSQSAGTRLADAVKLTLTEYEARFAGIDSELQAALERIVDTFKTTYEEMRERVNTVDGKMADSVTKLRGLNETFAEQAEEFNDTVERLAVALRSRA